MKYEAIVPGASLAPAWCGSQPIREAGMAPYSLTRGESFSAGRWEWAASSPAWQSRGVVL